MQERIPGSEYQQLQYFISESDWDAQGVIMEVARRTQASLSGQPGEQGLVLDESGWEKSGTRSVGVARQYIGQVGKVANGQVGVFAALTRGGLLGLAGARLYLPREWTDDAARCAAAGVPSPARSYRTKPELAVDILAQLRQQGIVADWVGGDPLYGNSPELRRALVRVWLWKPNRPAPPTPYWLLISREMDGTEVKFSLCHQPDGRVDLPVVLTRQMQRYFVERAFQDVKEQLGMHQYQVRSYKAWHHHIALTMMALHYMLQARIEMQEDWPLLSCPDVRLVIARSLINKLSSSQGVWEAIENRHRKRAADLLRRSHKT